jgi:hypothetical protein
MGAASIEGHTDALKRVAHSLDPVLAVAVLNSALT